jgi:hypothetical protein
MSTVWEPVLKWILRFGIWEDDLIWIDTDTWNDADGMWDDTAPSGTNWTKQ